MKWMDIAWADEGVREVYGPDAAPEIIAYFRDAGRDDILSDEVPWCAAFVAACIARAGIPVAIAKDQRLLARSYLKLGTPIETPRMGCIAVLTRGDPSGYTGHVGFVVGSTDTHIAVLGGNQANAVNVRHFPKSQVLGYRWPAPAAAPQDLDAAGSRITTSAKANVSDSAKAGGSLFVPDPVTVGGAIGVGAAAIEDPSSIVAQGQAAKGHVEHAIDLALFASAKWHWIMAMAGVYFLARIAWRSEWVRRWRTQEHNEGINTGRETGRSGPVGLEGAGNAGLG